MGIPRKAVLGILVDNLRKRKSVLPLSKKVATNWAKGLDLPRGGETIIYTGQMYQLIPAISSMAAKMAVFENSWITKFMGIGRIMNKVINLSFFMARRDKKMQAQFDQTLRSIALLLKASGLEFGYLFEEELYSGALVFDQGVDKVLKDHAERVQALLAEHGVKKIITVDPHTTQMLRDVYPKVLEDFDVEVKSYLEVLAERKPKVFNKLEGKVVIHDSCVYARYEDIVEQPRKLLAETGLELLEPELTGRSTHCCGGPIETLFPAQAHRLASSRVKQLGAVGDKSVAMCPICLVNLQGARGEDGPECRDIADILAESFLEAEPTPPHEE
ncbi:MAG: (Fe-S)-binding protein [Deltaproteobacteria bacterium]|nr:(Fe-S)-binding protein [Deltaproteobacteria bacterium]